MAVLRPMIDTGQKSAAASLATVRADCNGPDVVIGGPEPAASISRRRFRWRDLICYRHSVSSAAPLYADRRRLGHLPVRRRK